MPTRLRQVVLDAVEIRALAEFYRALLGYDYRPGDAPPAEHDWLVLRDPAGGTDLAFQQVETLAESTWPADDVPQQLHLDCTVRDKGELDAEHERVLTLGGRLLLDRSDDPEEALRVYADPAGHPFCIFVA